MSTASLARPVPAVGPEPGPAQLLARLGAIAIEVRAMAARRSELVAAAAHTSTGGPEAMLAATDEVIAAATSLKLASLHACEKHERWHRQGFASVEDWRAATSGQGRGAAARDTRMARDLADLTDTADALAQGHITPEHASVISRFAHGGDKDRRRDALSRDAEQRLLKLASRQDAGQFGKDANRIARAVDAQGVRDEFDKVCARRYLRVAKRNGGVHGEFLLDPLAGEKLLVALEAHRYRPAEGDERTAEQRAADALCDLAQSALDAGKSKSGALVRPHVSLVLTQDAFAAALARRRGVQPAGNRDVNERAGGDDPSFGAPVTEAAPDEAAGIGGPAGRLAAPEELSHLLDRLARFLPAGELEDGTLLPDYVIAALLCDCSIGRIVIDADGQPINVGRDERTASDELRRALLVRDTTCRFPGCTRLARWCDYHHIDAWARGGETSIDNGLMLCTHHHASFIHGKGVQIRRKPGRFEFYWPDGSLIGVSHDATARTAHRRRRRDLSPRGVPKRG